MTVAEVSVAGLSGIGGPSGAAFIGEVVVINLLAGNNELLLFCSGADEEALIDESVVAGCLASVGGVRLDWELDWVGPEAGRMRTVVGIDGAGEIEGVVGFLVAAGGEESCCAAEGGGAEGSADVLAGHAKVSWDSFRLVQLQAFK